MSIKMDLTALCNALNRIHFVNNIDQSTELIKQYFKRTSSATLEFKRTLNASVLEWDVICENILGCKLVFENNKYYLVNNKNKILIVEPCWYTKSNAAVPLNDFANSDYNMTASNNKLLEIHCDGYKLLYWLGYNSKKDVSIGSSSLELENDKFVQRTLINKNIVVKNIKFDIKETTKTFETHLAEMNSNLQEEVVPDFGESLNVMNDDLCRSLVCNVHIIDDKNVDNKGNIYGYHYMTTYSKLYSQFINKIFNASNLNVENVKSLTRYLFVCRSLIKNNIDTSQETCGIYYEFLKFKEEYYNHKQLAKELAAKRLIEIETEKQKEKAREEDAKVAKKMNALISKAFSIRQLREMVTSTMLLDVETFNEIYGDLITPEFVPLIDNLYAFDIETRKIFLKAYIEQ